MCVCVCVDLSLSLSRFCSHRSGLFTCSLQIILGPSAATSAFFSFTSGPACWSKPIIATAHKVLGKERPDIRRKNNDCSTSICFKLFLAR